MSTRFTSLARSFVRRSPLACVAVVMLAACILLLLESAAAAKTPDLDARGDENAGYVTLSWTPDEDPEGAPPVYEVQQADDAEFTRPTRVYRGPHTSTVLSGLSDGARWYRVRRVGGRVAGTWSAPKQFTVKHYPLSLAGGFFAVGALVFAVTAGFILKAGKDA